VHEVCANSPRGAERRMAKRLRLHPSIKDALRLPGQVNGAEVLRDWNRRTRKLCKPCWELHYCPYGPVVEDFPLLPPVRAKAKDHNERLKSALRSGRLLDGRPLDAQRRRIFRRMVADYKDEDFPEAVPKVLSEASCRVFGHLCPVFFEAELLPGTLTLRAHTRTISREVMLEVVRRDGQICQRRHEPVPDDEGRVERLVARGPNGALGVPPLQRAVAAPPQDLHSGRGQKPQVLLALDTPSAVAVSCGTKGKGPFIAKEARCLSITTITTSTTTAQSIITAPTTGMDIPTVWSTRRSPRPPVDCGR
jgi:hypothetical protein